jgi:protein SCO1/2
MKFKMIGLLAVFAIIALGVGTWIQVKANKKQNLELVDATLLQKSLALKPFHLVGAEGKTFTNKNLEGHWSMLFFGFTHCTMLCPTTMSRLNQAYEMLEKSKAAALPQVVFISVDPERDNPKRIQKYVQHFNPHFMGATGSTAELNALTHELGVAYMKAAKSGEKDYDIQHSGNVLIINPKGEWVAVLSTPQDAKSVADDFQKIISNI